MARGTVRWSILLGSLALVLALIAPFTVALSTRDLYQYAGPGSNVLETDNNGMLISAEAILKTPIVFYDKIYNSIFVSTDNRGFHLNNRVSVDGRNSYSNREAYFLINYGFKSTLERILIDITDAH